MKKRFLTFGILVIVLATIFVPAYFVHAQVTTANAINTGITALTASGGSIIGGLVADLFKAVATLLMGLSSLVLILCGKLFDYVVTFTIIDMAKNIGDPNGVGGAITAAWATLRDIANMCFIFVLLYAAFSAMFNSNFGNFQATVKNIIIVALLINFSLFFSKVVIDASNIVSVGFYKSVVNNQTNLGGSSISGISGGYMNMLGLQTFYSPKFLDNKDLGPGAILTIGIMSSVFMLITAIVLLIAGIMFAARFIILIFLMILSPLALIAYIIPGQKDQFDKWKNSLIDQSFFAPLYFALTWVVFKLGTSLLKVLQGQQVAQGGATPVWTNMTTDPNSAMPLIINYILIIGFSIAALIFSKSMASKTAGFKQISGGIGTAAIGGAALAGRQTAGRIADRVSQSQGLQNWASRSLIGQKVLQGTKGVAGGSFDVRGVANTKLGKVIKADKLIDATVVGAVSANAQGGYGASLQRQTDKKDKFAQSLSTDAQKQAYARRQMSGIKGIVTRGGSRSSVNSLFGTMGRSNRIVASKILSGQLAPITTARDNLNNAIQNMQNRDAQLNNQLNTAQTNLIALQNIVNPTAAQITQTNQIAANIANLQNQIQTNQNNLNNNQNQLVNLNQQVNALNIQINNLGLNNPKNTVPLTPQQQAQNAAAIAAGQPAPNVPRAARADEQKY